ncbi:PfaD family polyunsaturated fatty acid/polyketide biosynthesis protein [Pseudoalteromonas sp. MMG013]|uniref:PfaD family polyunsaturated fatty acid/polyketide biosynthesis protein n=1 Tax=Pseudoalteromonas sp. MMG013 TaxID=2822687 RepID=UPI001B376F39|nr:PfaD family polyunsaturated fatty acid/polyketide biosynthesis protein [Pseudoalteromonas sp. MMG013]MBQ4862403.1 PfaD family polyunsaturated fatty acid/polyketide biosynthesis protein [Pseudoalteromonas sp. MMG013]
MPHSVKLVTPTSNTEVPDHTVNTPLPHVSQELCITADSLGSYEFRQAYGLKYAYLSGAMYRGIASKELVIAMANAGLMGFLGTGGCSLDQIENDLLHIQRALPTGQAYGLNLVCNLNDPAHEMALVSLYLKYAVPCIEAAAFISMTPALVLYRVSGLYRDTDNQVASHYKIIAKVSRPEVANAFLQPAPLRIIEQLLRRGQITPEQAKMSQSILMCDDICVEADSGGHTDQGQPSVLLPAIQSLRDSVVSAQPFAHAPRIGLAGGIGTPTSAAAAFIMGADFIMTGSINQCTVEAGTSNLVKDMLQSINVQDTDYAPAGDMFELGSKVQVLKKGVFFPARANKLFQLYQQYDSINALPTTIQTQLQEKFFKKNFDEVWQEVEQYLTQTNRADDIIKAQTDAKYKMARIFRWYFSYSMKLAFSGTTQDKVNFQVHTGPALGAFNQWVKGSKLERWQNRHVADIANKLMQETAELLSIKTQQLVAFSKPSAISSQQ